MVRFEKRPDAFVVEGVGARCNEKSLTDRDAEEACRRIT